jgi:uncharacterized NAD(P)/FAD-binding protein YdhS
MLFRQISWIVQLWQIQAEIPLQRDASSGVAFALNVVMAETTDACCRPPLTFAHRCPEQVDVAIVGGGFSGLLTLLHVLRRAPHAHIAVFERTPRRAPGIAYGACGPSHLLNVRADRMGAFPDDPGAFYTWLGTRTPGRFQPSDFAPRALYGQYLLDVVTRELDAHQAHVDFVCDSVIDVETVGPMARLTLAANRQCLANAVVLALGLPMTMPAWADPQLSAVVADPWSTDGFSGLNRDETVVVAGTGLTALDLLVSLRGRGHRGTVLFVSRGGRFPLPHATTIVPAAAPMIDREALARGPRQALRHVRQVVEEQSAIGVDWQTVLDAVRPHVSATWQTWPLASRARFLRHLRPFWEIHRHRAPHSVLNLLKRGLADKRIATLRGTIKHVERNGEALRVTIRSQGRERTIDAGRVFNCLGPSMRIADTGDSLMRRMLDRGQACADVTSLGLCADRDGRIQCADGHYSERVFLLGALRRGDLWESTAVPELRLQAAAVGAAAAALVGAVDATVSGGDHSAVMLEESVR